MALCVGVQRWVVKDRTRIGIFAIKDIACDEPLCYDYQFDTQVEKRDS
jgi:SET domain-containing protein